MLSRSVFLSTSVRLCVLFALTLLLSACASAPAERVALTPIAHPIRFLLSFDDGPSAMNYANPTASILDDLAQNPVQPGIKALFFVQTRGPTVYRIGQQLLAREYAEGHLIGLHTATDGHRNHRFLAPAEFAASLDRGIADIESATGHAPTLVRPPFWSYDARTYATYRTHGLGMMLTDLSANDGVIWGFTASLHKRSNLYKELAAMRAGIVEGKFPVVNGVIPVIVTFHDTNSYTARHLVEYMQILTEVARELDMPTAARPFYDDRTDLLRAARARTVRDPSESIALPGFWGWVWTEARVLFGTEPSRN
ncbi:MAG TPA: polysaccharide deacetylase family protein [Oxalicibacterium sp.]|nr:polysaccharide deacetylase family protein [Oxalicibacterium sp.]